MSRAPAELIEFLHRYDPSIQALALGLRKVVHEEVGPCHEYIFDMRSKVVLLYGATEKVIKSGICNIGVYRRHVTLGFPRGADLADPDGVLKGTGKGMRHVSVNRLSDLDRPDIRALLRRARTHAGLRRARQRTPDDVVTRVKARLPPAFL